MAEEGVDRTEESQTVQAKRELRLVLGNVDFASTEWATYRVDRAEGRTSTGLRPDGPTMLVEGNVITAWPTKLALAPRLATMVAEVVEKRRDRSCVSDDAESLLMSWPRPKVALPPWETLRSWRA